MTAGALGHALVELGDVGEGPVRRAARLVAGDQGGVEIEGGVLDALGRDRAGQLLPAQDESERVGVRVGDRGRERARPAARARRGRPQPRPVGRAGPAVADVRAVDVQARGQLAQRTAVGAGGREPGDAVEVRREQRGERRPLRGGGDVGEAVGQTGQAAVGGVDVSGAVWVDEEPAGQGEEVVAGGAGGRPVRRQRLVPGEDLLDDDVGAAGRVAQPLEVVRRVAQPVDVVDAQAGDHPLAHEPHDLRVRRREHVLVLDGHGGQVGDVEEAAVVAARRRASPRAGSAGPRAAPRGRPPPRSRQRRGSAGRSRPRAARRPPARAAARRLRSRRPRGEPSSGRTSRPSAPGASQSMSNACAWGESRPRRSTSHHQRLRWSAAMWLGTMSTMRPMSSRSSSAGRAASASAPPSSGFTRVGSMTS